MLRLAKIICRVSTSSYTYKSVETSASRLRTLSGANRSRYSTQSYPPGPSVSPSTSSSSAPPKVMVALPLFKLGTLFIRHISKYGANRIKIQAHEHPGFRRFAARYGQYMHQFNMRMNVSLLRNTAAEIRAKEKAEAPTVMTKAEFEKEEARRAKTKPVTTEAPKKKVTILNVWRRKFRPLPEEKAVDLFADVLGDAFILFVASAIILYEWQKSSSKPDHNSEQIRELTQRFAELEKREATLLEAEKQQQDRVLLIEEALRGLTDPKTKQPLLAASPTPVALPEVSRVTSSEATTQTSPTSK